MENFHEPDLQDLPGVPARKEPKTLCTSGAHLDPREAAAELRIHGRRVMSLCRVCALALSSDLQEAVDETDPQSTGDAKVTLPLHVELAEKARLSRLGPNSTGMEG